MDNEEKELLAILPYAKCMAAAIIREVEPGIASMEVCKNPADPTRMRIIAYDGWAMLIPLCPAHIILWNADVEQI